MYMVGTPEAEDSKNRMETHSMVGVSKFSFAEECKNLFKDEIRIDEVNLENKYKKR